MLLKKSTFIYKKRIVEEWESNVSPKIKIKHSNNIK